MSKDNGMPKADTRHLYKRGQWWWLKIRIPATQRIHRQALKTKNLGEAQNLRNQLLEEQRWLIDRHDYAVRLKQLREEYLDSVDEGEREIFREEIIESSEDMAADLGVLELYRGPKRSNLDLVTDKELGPWKAYKTAVDELTPIELVKSDWLETIKNKQTKAQKREIQACNAQGFQAYFIIFSPLQSRVGGTISSACTVVQKMDEH